MTRDASGETELATLPPTDTAPEGASTLSGSTEGAVCARAAHVFVFNARREVLLRRLQSPAGMPHAARWTTGIAAELQPGESYDAAATRAARDVLNARLPAMRYVGKAWIDLHASADRTFVAVFAAAHEAPLAAPDGCAWVPIPPLLRALRHGARDLDPAFARACRVITGDDDW